MKDTLSEGLGLPKPQETNISYGTNWKVAQLLNRWARDIYTCIFEKWDFWNFQWWRFKWDINWSDSKRKRLEIILDWRRASIPITIKNILLELFLDPSTHILDCRRFIAKLIWVNPLELQWNKLKKNDLKNPIPWRAYCYAKRYWDETMFRNWTNWWEYHFFLYLWNWLYLSKPWRNCEIIITNQEELQRGFFWEDYETYSVNH